MESNVNKFMDEQLIETEEVEMLNIGINKVYREFGITPPTQRQQMPIRHKSKTKDPYVRTIPQSWVIKAMELPGKALHVGIVLWFFSGVSKSPTVKLTRSRLRYFGIQHETGRRALIALEKGNLVTVKREGHRSPLVTILKVSTEPSKSGPGSLVIREGDGPPSRVQKATK